MHKARIYSEIYFHLLSFQSRFQQFWECYSEQNVLLKYSICNIYHYSRILQNWNFVL